MAREVKKRTMFTATGVDGCPAGWFFVSLPPCGPAQWNVVCKVEDLVERAGETDRIFVDIPIGLPDGPEGRACDFAARKVLGRPRASSVFPAPARFVLAASDYDDARRRSLKATGGKITKQAFAILPRIREVDALMRHSAKARRLVRELHPEVCFWALNGRQPMKHRKKSETGFRERLDVLKCARPTADMEIAAILGHSRPKGIARDDVLDAMAAALTAAQETSVLRMLPPCPPRDSAGLPMEMVYAECAPT